MSKDRITFRRGGLFLKEWNQCPKCGFKGLMLSWETRGYIGKKYKCPECHHKFGNLKRKI